ncbi:MAG: Clp1/GlmU family protein [Armatimonadota bacterium]
MRLNIINDWESHIDEILSVPGIIAVIGETDTGKTSFCSLLANRALDAGISTAVVDADMGQSEIGPPATIGLGLVDEPIQTLRDLHQRGLYFIGATSPVNHLLATASGVKILADKASALKRNLIIADTTGLIRGAIARRLKTYKIELLRPRHIVAIQKTDEAEHILRYFDTWQDCMVHRLPPSPEVKAKSRILRTQRRSVRFQEYFIKGNVHHIPINSISTSCTWLHTGSPMESRFLKYAEGVLKTTVFHGEFSDSGVYLVVSGDYNRRGLDELQEYFKTRNINIVPASRYLNLLVGLMDSHLDLLALGIIQRIDFRAQSMTVYTPMKTVTPVRSIRFGVLKIRPDGSEIGQLRPGEL